ncbi:MAG TPA: hypothetical protein DCM08_01990 [Microscillaceae bacterium]|nr:hypothetical protein [Microscillaceae bacterium]
MSRVLFKNECNKYFALRSYWLVVCSPALVYIIVFSRMYLLTYYELKTFIYAIHQDLDPYNCTFRRIKYTNNLFTLPLVASLCYVVYLAEKQSKGWQRSLSLPIHFRTVVGYKVLFLLFSFGLMSVLNILLANLTLFVLPLLKPDLLFAQYPANVWITNGLLIQSLLLTVPMLLLFWICLSYFQQFIGVLTCTYILSFWSNSWNPTAMNLLSNDTYLAHRKAQYVGQISWLQLFEGSLLIGLLYTAILLFFIYQYFDKITYGKTAV